MIRVVEETGSTNADLTARLHAGEYLVEGDWLVANRQTAGRGRAGRDWSDGAGNFMGSTVVHLHAAQPAPQTLALVAGLAVHAAVVADIATDGAFTPPADDGDVLRLKWPNDLLYGDAKLAGILLEREQDSVIVGIGVNLVASPTIADRPVISIAEITSGSHKAEPDRDRFAERVARSLALELARWREFGLAPILRRWCSAAHTEGTPLRVSDPAGTIEGSFAGLTDQGELRLRLADGGVRIVSAGEVRLAAMAGE